MNASYDFRNLSILLGGSPMARSKLIGRSTHRHANSLSVYDFHAPLDTHVCIVMIFILVFVVALAIAVVHIIVFFHVILGVVTAVLGG